MSDSTTRTITIAGAEFEVTAPFAKGHTCTEAEAKALNQTRAENIRNNMAKFVRDAKDEDDSIPAKAMKELVEKVTTYDAEYQFTLANAGGRSAIDPIEKEATKIAREGINVALQEAGKKLADYRGAGANEELKATYENAIATRAASDEVIALAKSRIEERKTAAAGALDSLGL